MNEPKKLHRSRTDRKIAGVLGGIADYLNVDATAIRVLYVLIVVLTGGAGLIAYPILWVIMPEEPERAPDWPTTAATGAGQPPATQPSQPPPAKAPTSGTASRRSGSAKPPADNPPAE